MRRSEQRRAAVFALYQHDLTKRPLDDVFERDAADFTRADLRRSRFPLAVFRQTIIDSARVFGISLVGCKAEGQVDKPNSASSVQLAQ